MIISALYSNSFAQANSIHFTIDNFNEEILRYQPIQREGVSDKDFNRGIFYLEQTVKATEGKPENLHAVDYWNITMAFLKLKEPKGHIALSFQMAAENDPNSLCQVLEAYGEKSLSVLSRYIPEEANQFHSGCKEILAQKEVFDPVAYAQENQLDLQLVQIMDNIRKSDQLYRNEAVVDWSKQTPIDQRNMEIIDSLYQVHRSYIGKELVGDQLASTMWAVVQHSTIEKMEAYLPIIHRGVKAGDLHSTPLKMLIDRVYATKHGYQFFGSQSGIELASDEARAEIVEEYGLK